ncbi:plasma membrane ATPase 1-like [Dorcoceras hygrometricum]|uniref:Plasma membrane ATPase 1-like n=1 Tax=Dorcoceras hygrometricum TaxID=472368 RepID=A0A2Z7CAJ6_9LAMI|nr:plasma membrane ATPase 1-like [Dorcoceras hygrometricum]
MFLVDWAVKMRIRPPEFETSICDAKYHVSLSTRSVLGKCVYLVTLAMSLFDLQDVCIAIGSLATLDLPMVVDLIGIYGLKGPYSCTRKLMDFSTDGNSSSRWPEQVRRGAAARGKRRGREVERSIRYPRMRASGESSTTKHRLLHASGSHPIPPPNDPKSCLSSYGINERLPLGTEIASGNLAVI